MSEEKSFPPKNNGETQNYKAMTHSRPDPSTNPPTELPVSQDTQSPQIPTSTDTTPDPSSTQESE